VPPDHRNLISYGFRPPEGRFPSGCEPFSSHAGLWRGLWRGEAAICPPATAGGISAASDQRLGPSVTLPQTTGGRPRVRSGGSADVLNGYIHAPGVISQCPLPGRPLKGSAVIVRQAFEQVGFSHFSK